MEFKEGQKVTAVKTLVDYRPGEIPDIVTLAKEGDVLTLIAPHSNKQFWLVEDAQGETFFVKPDEVEPNE